MLTNKLPGKGTNIFTVMSKMAQEHGAINLAQGFPDFDGPPALLERVAWHIARGHNQYAPLNGVPQLRKQIAAKILDLYNREIDPDHEVVVTPGATEAIFCAITAVVHPGDEVIVFDPAYDTYEPGVTLNGGIKQHLSLLRFPDLAARSFVISSFGKTYHTTGWRIGYCIAPRPLMIEFLRIHQFINFSTHTPMQYAIADFLSECQQHHRELGGFYQQKRDLFLKLMAPSRFKLIPSKGTYFQLASYDAISSEPDTEFATRLTGEHKVASIPVSVFYNNPPDQNVIRFCFAKHDSTLREAAKILVDM
jgi:aspartate/methionine/tyrosine aminotransferase